MLHQRWLANGEAAFDVASSRILSSRWAITPARYIAFGCPSHIAMSHPWLAPTVSRGKGLRRGSSRGNTPPHLLNPQSPITTFTIFRGARATGSVSSMRRRRYCRNNLRPKARDVWGGVLCRPRSPAGCAAHVERGGVANPWRNPLSRRAPCHRQMRVFGPIKTRT